jgi:uncharacterized protein Smg (DUF494 family)
MFHLMQARQIAAALPRSREASLVLTKIDEALMWLSALTSTQPTTTSPAPAQPVDEFSSR